MPGLSRASTPFFLMTFKTWMAGTSPAMTAERILDVSYFTAEKRLSNELEGTIGWEPATMASFAAGAGAGSETVGLNGGRTAATLVSAGFGAMVLGTVAEGRGVSLASMTFGLAGTAVEVVSAPVNPTLRAKLEKKPSDCAFGAAYATRVRG